MKKTIIALLALAGAAAGDSVTGTFTGATVINTQLQNLISSNGYYANTSYCITLSGITTLGSDGNDVFFNLGDQYDIRNQAWYFLTFSAEGENVKGENMSWTAASENSVVTDATNKIITTTLTTEDTGSWITPSLGTDGSIKADGTTNSSITSFSFAYDAQTDTSIITTFRQNGITNIVNITDLYIDPTKVGFYHSNTAATGTISFIPEPATATLSLLALAGLAARRRRK